MARLLGIDVGTSGAKALLIDEAGRVLCSSTSSYPLSIPQPLWAEQDPEMWWQGVQECLAEVELGSIDAIGLTGQMHGAVFLDADGEVIRPAMLWNDQRTSAECRRIEAMLGPRLLDITLNPMLTGFQAPKILWLREHEPEAFRRIRSVLLPKDYIRYRLTGEMATDPSDASGTGLFDIRRREWSGELIGALGFDQTWFPPVRESSEVVGCTGSRVPVVSGAGDQAAAAVGTGAVRAGIVSISLGTSGVVFSALPQHEMHPSGALHTFCHANGGWHAMVVMLSCGGALRWYRDVLRDGTPYEEIAESAATAEPGCGGLTFLPYLTGERCPHNDPFARAAFVGATLATTRADFDRAVFEGVTFGLADGFSLMKELGVTGEQIRVTGGGAKSPFWVGMIADVLDTECVTLEADEGPAFGAALLAGVGIGLWSDTESATDATVRLRQSFSGNDRGAYGAVHETYRGLYGKLHLANGKEDV
jgi:xylulokinase